MSREERFDFGGVMTAIEYGYETGFQAFEHEADLREQATQQDPLSHEEAAELAIIEIHKTTTENGADRLFIPGVARADLQYFGTEQQTAAFTNFKVHPEWRGQGIGSLLFESAVDRANGKGCTELETVAANERTAHLFRGRFPEENLTFFRLNKAEQTIVPLDLSLDGVILYLMQNRKFMPPDSPDDAQLADFIPRVLINARLR